MAYVVCKIYPENMLIILFVHYLVLNMHSPLNFLPILQNMNEDLYIGRATGNVKSSSIHAMHKVLRYILEYKLHDFIGIVFF